MNTHILTDSSKNPKITSQLEQEDVTGRSH